jgi:hypothetical protein
MDNNMMTFIKSITEYEDATILHLYQTWVNNNPKKPEVIKPKKTDCPVCGFDYDSADHRQFCHNII